MPKMNLSDREKALIVKQREEDKIWNAAIETVIAKLVRDGCDDEHIYNTIKGVFR